MDKKQSDMLLSILDGIDGAMDDSVMEGVKQRKPDACITISISGPGAKMKNEMPEEPLMVEDESEEDELGKRLAAAAKK